LYSTGEDIEDTTNTATKYLYVVGRVRFMKMFQGLKRYLKWKAKHGT
jgi:hypothetical protein